MSDDKKEKSGCLIKVYLLILFIAGIILALSYQSAQKKGPNQKSEQQQTSVESKNTSSSGPIDVMLDNNIITALTSSGLQQQNVVKQYVKEMKDKNTTYNQYFKEIKLNKGQKPENFEPILKTIARNFKIALSKTGNIDGSIKYLFYDKKRTYSELVLK